MTPKEQADYLFTKFYLICQEYTEECQCSIQAIQCALVHVEEMKKYNKSRFDEKFWNQVETELHKL